MKQPRTKYTRNRVAEHLAIFALLTLIGLSLTGCGIFRNRSRDLVFHEVRLDIDAISHEGDRNQWQTVCELINRYAEFDCQNVVRTNCQQVGSIRVCDYDTVILKFSPPLSLDGLRHLHGELVALEQEGVTLGLKTGSIVANYVGLTSEGSISVTVHISVTPGATLFLERRWEAICEKVKTSNNLFEGEISLRKGQEWVYYRTEVQTESDLARRYFRLNVISKGSEELTGEEFDRLISRP